MCMQTAWLTEHDKALVYEQILAMLERGGSGAGRDPRQGRRHVIEHGVRCKDARLAHGAFGHRSTLPHDCSRVDGPGPRSRVRP